MKAILQNLENGKKQAQNVPPFKHGVIVLFLLTLVLGITTLAFPITGTDAGVYTYIANTMLDGGIPYRDAWDPSGPGIFFVFAIKALIFGNSDVSLRVFDLFWQFCTAIALMYIGGRVFQNRRVGLLAGILYLLVYFARYFPDMANKDGFVSLPLALAVIFFLRGLDSDRMLSWAMSGFFVGIAALFKFPMGLMGIIMAFTAIALRPLQFETILKRLSSLAVGFVTTFLLCGLYFALMGGLKDLLFTQFVFAPEYVNRERIQFTLKCLVDRTARIEFIPLFAMAALALGWIVASNDLRGKLSLQKIIIVGWLAITGFVLVYHGRYLLTHSLPVIAPLALLSAPSLYSLSSIERKKRNLPQWLLLVLVSFALILPVVERSRRNLAFSRTVISGQPTLTQWFDLKAWDDLANYIREHTSPEDEFFLWGNQTSVYIDADRKSPTRFIHSYFLSIPWQSADFRKTFIEEFEANLPPYFVLVKEKVHNPCNDLYVGSLMAFDQFNVLKSIIAREYETELDTEYYQVFRHK